MSISSSYYKLCKHHLLELHIFCSGETIIYLIYCTLFIPLFCYYAYKYVWHEALSPFQNLHQVELLGTSKVTHGLRSLTPIAQLLSKKACRSTPSSVMQGTLHFITTTTPPSPALPDCDGQAYWSDCPFLARQPFCWQSYSGLDRHWHVAAFPA